jgi:hypothetical protein
VSHDGSRVVFAAKTAQGADWQIYEVKLSGNAIKPLTAAPGGAMNPALLADGSLLYVSPVPKAGVSNSSGRTPSIYVQPPGGHARQLTFSTASIYDPTVLADGRVLFVSAQPSATASVPSGLALYTMNNDGTEVSAFAGQHDVPKLIRRPRQLPNGQIIFISSDAANSRLSTAEYVLSARPFRSRAPLFPNSMVWIRSVQPAPNGDLLVCAEPEAGGVGGAIHSCAVYRLGPAAPALDASVLQDPDWDTIEAICASPSPRPMGRLSNVDLNRKTGQILCLNVNDTTYVAHNDQKAPRATRVRILTELPSGTQGTLGEVAVQSDGSFMAEVPSDVPLGFDALDEQGRVLRHEPPLIWVRPGENRSCIGCHEPHNHSPRNLRPLAVEIPAPKLPGEPAKLAQSTR